MVVVVGKEELLDLCLSRKLYLGCTMDLLVGVCRV